MISLCTNELLKLRTVRTPWLLLGVGPLLVIAGIAGVVVGGADLTKAATANQAIGHVGIMSLISLIFGIMAVAGEYRRKTITDTYLTTPRRGRVIAAKLIVYTVVGLAYGIVLAVLAVVVTLLLFGAKGASVDLGAAGLWRALGGDIVWNGLFAALGVALGALVRNLAMAIAIALSWIALVEELIGQLVGGFSRWLPFAAGEALGDLPGTSVSQWLGALVLCAYVAVFVAVARVISIRRDVT